MKFDLNEINQLVEAGFVVKQKHPVHPIWIYNYTNACQWDKKWNKTTLACRGLVLDEEGNVLARSFPKFFNYEELQPEEIPVDEPYTITVKMDGSLILAFKYNDEFIVASRGSFTSEQALKAQTLFTTKQKDWWPDGITGVFEIIYPENRVVVDYGADEKLILLGIIRSEDGAEKDYGDVLKGGLFMGFEVVKLISSTDYLTLREQIPDNEEGYVINFYRKCFRMKIKGAEYCRLHRIMTCISSRDVWEYLSEGKDIAPIIDKVPDEFMGWVKDTVEKLQSNYEMIDYLAAQDFSQIVDYNFDNLPDRKIFAERVKKQARYPHLMFKLYDKKDYLKDIWKLIYLKRELPWKNGLCL